MHPCFLKQSLINILLNTWRDVMKKDVLLVLAGFILVAGTLAFTQFSGDPEKFQKYVIVAVLFSIGAAFLTSVIPLINRTLFRVRLVDQITETGEFVAYGPIAIFGLVFLTSVWNYQPVVSNVGDCERFEGSWLCEGAGCKGFGRATISKAPGGWQWTRDERNSKGYFTYDPFDGVGKITTQDGQADIDPQCRVIKWLNQQTTWTKNK
jgi:hypothetical protein